MNSYKTFSIIGAFIIVIVSAYYAMYAKSDRLANLMSDLFGAFAIVIIGLIFVVLYKFVWKKLW